MRLEKLGEQGRSDDARQLAHMLEKKGDIQKTVTLNQQSGKSGLCGRRKRERNSDANNGTPASRVVSMRNVDLGSDLHVNGGDDDAADGKALGEYQDDELQQDKEGKHEFNVMLRMFRMV